MKSRKKRILWIAAMTGVLLLTAGCGQPAGNETDGKEGGSSQSGTDSKEGSSSQSVADGKEGGSSQSEITFEKEHFAGESPEDKKEFRYTYEYDVLKITIPGREEVQERIQKELDEYVESFLASVDNGSFGRVWEDEEPLEESYMKLYADVIRADDKVISLMFGNEGYDGGVHGWYTTVYFNYFAETGERITFEKLGDGFREKAEELVLQKAGEVQARENILFDGYENSIPLVVEDGTENLQEVYERVFGDWADAGGGVPQPSFFVTDTGFVFVSGQYVLQPYAAGIVTFEIPAEEFGDACRADIFELQK